MLRVLTYHRIAVQTDDPAQTPGLVSVGQKRFAEHVRLLARDFEPVSLEQVLDAVRQGKSLGHSAVLVTFDDAYCDFKDIAWPILARHHVPVTLFVPTAYVERADRLFWWDRLYRCLMRTKLQEVPARWGPEFLRDDQERRGAFLRIRNLIKALPHEEAMTRLDRLCAQLGETPIEDNDVLTWDDLRKLEAQGVAMASHSHTHPLLNRVTREQVVQEIEYSQRLLEHELANVFRVFSYPNGAHDETAVEVLRDRGFELAFTQIPGHNDLGTSDPLRLCRTNVTRRTSAAFLRLRLQPWFGPIDRWRKRRRIQMYQSETSVVAS